LTFVSVDPAGLIFLILVDKRPENLSSRKRSFYFSAAWKLWKHFVEGRTFFLLISAISNNSASLNIQDRKEKWARLPGTPPPPRIKYLLFVHCLCGRSVVTLTLVSETGL
jgi:hypothetical protein